MNLPVPIEAHCAHWNTMFNIAKRGNEFSAASNHNALEHWNVKKAIFPWLIDNETGLGILKEERWSLYVEKSKISKWKARLRRPRKWNRFLLPEKNELAEGNHDDETLRQWLWHSSVLIFGFIDRFGAAALEVVIVMRHDDTSMLVNSSRRCGC